MSSEKHSDRFADNDQKSTINQSPELRTPESENQLVPQNMSDSPAQMDHQRDDKDISSSANLAMESVPTDRSTGSRPAKTGKRITKSHLVAALIAVSILFVIFAWPRFVDYTNGPIPLSKQENLLLVVPGRYLICLERTAAQSASSVDVDTISSQTTILHGESLIPLKLIEKPGKYGSFFPFSISRIDKNGIEQIEQPIRCFDVKVPGTYTLSTRAPAETTRSVEKINLAVVRDKDLLSVLPTLPLILVLLAIPLVIAVAICHRIIAFQPSLPWLKFVWNRLLCLAGFAFIQIGLLFGSGALTQMVMRLTDVSPEILLGAVFLFGLFPLTIGAALLWIQLNRFFRHSGDIDSVVFARIWKVLMLGIATLLITISSYAAAVCVATLHSSHTGFLAKIPYWGAPPDIAYSVLSASIINVIISMIIFRLQFHSVKKQSKD